LISTFSEAAAASGAIFAQALEATATATAIARQASVFAAVDAVVCVVSIIMAAAAAAAGVASRAATRAAASMARQGGPEVAAYGDVWATAVAVTVTVAAVAEVATQEAAATGPWPCSCSQVAGAPEAWVAERGASEGTDVIWGCGVADGEAAFSGAVKDGVEVAAITAVSLAVAVAVAVEVARAGQSRAPPRHRRDCRHQIHTHRHL